MCSLCHLFRIMSEGKKALGALADRMWFTVPGHALILPYTMCRCVGDSTRKSYAGNSPCIKYVHLRTVQPSILYDYALKRRPKSLQYRTDRISLHILRRTILSVSCRRRSCDHLLLQWPSLLARQIFYLQFRTEKCESAGLTEHGRSSCCERRIQVRKQHSFLYWSI